MPVLIPFFHVRMVSFDLSLFVFLQCSSPTANACPFLSYNPVREALSRSQRSVAAACRSFDLSLSLFPVAENEEALRRLGYRRALVGTTVPLRDCTPVITERRKLSPATTHELPLMMSELIIRLGPVFYMNFQR